MFDLVHYYKARGMKALSKIILIAEQHERQTAKAEDKPAYPSIHYEHTGADIGIEL